MKKHLVILLLFVAVKLFPQQINQATQQPSQQPNQAVYDKITKYKKMKIGGIVMLSAGGVALVSGIAMFASGLIEISTRQNTYNNQFNTYILSSNTYPYSAQPPVQPNNADLIPKMAGGVVLGIVGGLAVAGGTFMYIRGKHKEKKWRNNLSAFVAPTAFRFTYKF